MSMIQCKFCQSEVPDNSHFCGRCGRTIKIADQGIEGQATILSHPGFDSLPTVGRPDSPDSDSSPTVGGLGELAIGLLPLSGVPGSAPPGHVPMVQGTPQVGGVPSVQGAPQLPNGAAGHGSPSLPQHELSHQEYQQSQSAHPQQQADHPHQPEQHVSHSPHHTLHPEHHPHHQVSHSPHHTLHPEHHPHQQHHQPTHLEQQPAHVQPQVSHPQHQAFQQGHQQFQQQVSHPQQQLSQQSHQPFQQGHQLHQPAQHAQQQLHLPAHQSSSTGGAASRASHGAKAQHGCRPSCLTTVVSGAVCAALIASIVAFFAVPSLRQTISSIFGPHHPVPSLGILNGTVVPGGLLSIHGSNFSSGGTISITVDGQPATIASTGGSASQPAPYALAAFSLVASQAVVPSAGTTVPVRSDGTFDVTIRVAANWSVGSSHTLVATEQSSGQLAQLKITVPQQPGLTSCSKTTSTTTLTLGPVNQGQQQAVAAPFTLCTTGSGTVNWTASWDHQQAPWLQLPQSGTIQAPLMRQLQVSASAGGLKAGTYSTTVTVSSQGSSMKMTLKVEFIVRSMTKTCISTNTQSLPFTGTKGQADPTPQKVTIRNCGSAGSWTVSTKTDDGANWLSVGSQGSNLQSKASQDVPIQVSSAKLQQGTYTGQVTFKLGSSIAVVNVMFTVQPPVQSTCITAGPTSLTFAAIQNRGDPKSQTAIIGNCGSSGAWTASISTTDGANWLSVSPSNGNLNANATQNVSISVASAGLQQATYIGQVTFTLGSSTAVVNVMFNFQQMQPQPCLSVSPQTLPFTSTQGQGDPSSQTVTLSNCGPSGSWSASITKGSSWLSLNRTSDNLSAGMTENVTVSVSTANLSPNPYTGQITFTLGSSSVQVSVMLMVLPPPACIQTNPQSLTFPSTQTSLAPTSQPVALTATQGQGYLDSPREPLNPHQSVTLTNCGDTGNWSASVVTDDGASWLNLYSSSGSPTTGGTLNAGATDNVFVGVNIEAINKPGTYTGHITFTITTSSGQPGSTTVNVTFIVSCIQANQHQFSFTGVAGQSDPSTQTVTITNCGDTGSWSSYTNDGAANWLSISPTGGPLNGGASQDITITASNLTAKLSAGTYSGYIVFFLGNAVDQVNITLTVSSPQTVPPPPCINVSPPSLSFTGVAGQSDPSPQPLVLTNCGDPGSWSASVSTSDGANWLSIDTPGGSLSAGQTAQVTITASNLNANLPAGTYTGQITFTIQTSSGGTASITVNVTLTVM